MIDEPSIQYLERNKNVQSPRKNIIIRYGICLIQTEIIV